MKSADTPTTAAPTATAMMKRRDRQLRKGITSYTLCVARRFGTPTPTLPRKRGREKAKLDACDPENVPFARNALQRMRAAILEDDPRAGHQVFDGARGENLTRTGQSSNP